MKSESSNRGQGRTRLVSFLISMATLAAIGGVAYWELGHRRSPGPLHPSHAAVSELRGSTGCAQCHGKSDDHMDESCTKCHTEIQAQLDRKSGIHGTENTLQGRTCRECHKDHAGNAVALVSALSWSLASLEAGKDFKHDPFVEFTLAGKHATLECFQCHTNVRKSALRKDEWRYLGLSQDCASCHEDVHKGEFGLDCASCHGQEKPFAEVANFTHTDRFLLTGSHGGLKCIDCHDPDRDQPVATLLKQSPAAVRACADCHESAHSPAFIAEASRMANVSEGASCEQCHAIDDTEFVFPEAEMPRELHAASGFRLDLPHDKVECASCHDAYSQEAPSADGDARMAFAARYPGRKQQECEVCHEDPHQGQFDAGFSEGKCLRCHDATRFEPPAFGAEIHALTAFPLTGKHTGVDCASCHDYEQEPVKFTQVATACSACHEDIHRGAFDGPGAPKASNGQQGCARCHDTSSFRNVVWDAADHRAWTGYPLEGGHNSAKCAQCHEPAGTYAATYGATATACASCHEDAHRGAFDATLAKRGDANPGCAECHTTEAFSAVTWTLDDHAQWAGYSLTGAHASVRCDQCHGASQTTGIPHRTFGVAERACASCHKDPHGGQFATADGNDCARCHDPATVFRGVAFDHQTQSRFVLDEFHAKIDCGFCHRPFKTAEGDIAIRYRPLGSKCQDCHTFSSYGEAPK